ncbi:MAG: hypothetical protein ACI4TV_02955 [Paludibacteraceae bacterium]
MCSCLMYIPSFLLSSFRLFILCLLFSPLLPLRGAERLSWQQAEQVLHTADSLDAQGVIYRDTAAFQSVIRTYDRPVVRCLKHSDLGKAYYYLGRNYEDYHQRYLSAAKCYTRSDQCRISDPIMRGRINSCMEWMCSQNKEYEYAIVYNQRACTCFQESKNLFRYAHCLLQASSIEQARGNFISSDSLWQIAVQYNFDSDYAARLYISRGVYFYSQGLLDSAKVQYQKVTSEVLSEDLMCFLNLHLMRLYYKMDYIEDAVVYANYIVAHSTNLSYCIDAYYTLMRYAEQTNDIEKLASYSHSRADLYRLRIKQTKDQEEALAILENHIESAGIIHKKKVIGVVGSMMIAMLLIGVVAYIMQQKKKVRTLCTVQEENTHQRHVKTIEKLEKQLDLCAEYLVQHDEVWTDDAAFLNTINLYLWNMADTLRASYHLSVQDIKICVMTLLNMSRKEMAEKLFRAESSIPQMRARVAKRMGIPTQELRDFLFLQLEN